MKASITIELERWWYIRTLHRAAIILDGYEPKEMDYDFLDWSESLLVVGSLLECISDSCCMPDETFEAIKKVQGEVARLAKTYLTN